MFLTRLFSRDFQAEEFASTVALLTTAFKPSKVEGVCDVCGKPIVIRKDDEPATVISRLQTYHKSTAPLKDYYGKQGKLVTVEGQDKVEDTSKLVLEAVKA